MSLGLWKPDDIVERDSSKNADDIICNKAVQKSFLVLQGRQMCHSYATVSLLCKSALSMRSLYAYRRKYFRVYESVNIMR